MPRAKIASDSSSGEALYQAQLMPAAHADSSVDFPKPASATTMVRRRSRASSRRAKRRSRPSSDAGATGGSNFVVAVALGGAVGDTRATSAS